MAIIRKAAGALLAMVAGYAIKKMMSRIEAQATQMREQAEQAKEPRAPKDLKQLKQDPVTGVYYAED